jgi:hypothetical protein
VLYLGSRLYFKAKWVSPENMDFVTNIAEIEADTYDDPPPKNKLEAFWQWLVSTCPETYMVLWLLNPVTDVIRVETNIVSVVWELFRYHTTMLCPRCICSICVLYALQRTKTVDT